MPVSNLEAIANVEAERGFLAALTQESWTDPAKARSALDGTHIVAERFHLPAHREVFGAVAALLAEGKSADLTVLRAKLAHSQAVAGAGGWEWLAALIAEPALPYEIPTLADEIRRAALRRKLVSVARDLMGRAADAAEDPAVALDAAVRALSGISLTKRTIRTLSEVMVDVAEEIDDVRLRGNSRIVPTGFAHLDAAITGWQPTLTIIGALPGVGKSAVLASVVRAMAVAKRTVGLFSLEDDAKWLGYRLLASESGVQQVRLRSGRMTKEQADASVDAIKGIADYGERVLIDDRSGLSPAELVQTARDMIVNRGAKAIVVDHLGELRYEGKHRERYDLEVMEGLSDLREIAKRFGVPVIVACHLKRRQGLGPGDQAQPSDFANSSAIERQARVALSLAREPDSDTLTVHVLKQTNGRPAISVDLRFDGLSAMVLDCEGEPQNYYPDR